MKQKIISWMLAIACCFSLLPGNLVTAAETGETELPVTTVAYFTNQSEFKDSGNYAQAVTVTGSAVVEVGEKTRWDYGLIMIEPNDQLKKKGYTFDKAWYSSGENNSTTLGTSTVAQVLAGWRNSVTIPSKISNDINSKQNYTSIEINSTLYNQIRGKTIFIEFKNNTGESVTQRLNIRSFYVQKNIQNWQVNTQFDLFGDNILGQEIGRNDWTRSDFTIAAMRRTGTSSDRVPEGFLEGLDNTGDDFGKYSALRAGIYHFNVSDKKTGIIYTVFVNVVLDEDAPLKEGSIIVSNNASINYNNLPQAMINVRPKNSNEFVMKNVDFSFNLPEGASIDWSSIQVDDRKPSLGLEMNKEKIFSHSVWTGVNNETEETQITFLATEQNGQPKLSIESDCGLKLTISFDIRYKNKVYNYSITLVQNSYLGVRSGTYSLHPNATMDIFSFLDIYEPEAENKQRFLDNVNNETYRLTVPGVEEYSKPFDGNVLFAHPGNARLNIYDTQLKVRVASEPMQVIMRDNIIKRSTDSLNLKELINGYWETSYNVECDGAIENYLDENQNICVRKSETATGKDGTVTIWNGNGNNKVLAAVFGITFSDSNTKEDFFKDIINAIKGLGENANTSVDMTGDKEAEISADVLNALINAGSGRSLTITLESSSGSKVEWSFKSGNLKNANKNIALNVNVGEDVNNSELNGKMSSQNIGGLKLGFANNGELPGEVEIRLYLSDEEARIIGGDSDIYLYYFDNDDGRLIKERSGLTIKTIGNKKYISIPITHNSDFLLSTKDLNSTSGTISGGGVSVAYTPAPTTAPTATPVATPSPSPTAAPTATAIPVPTTAPVATITPVPTNTPAAIPTAAPEETNMPDVTPTVTPSVKNQVKKVKAVKKKVEVKKNKKLNINFKIVATDNKKVVTNKANATVNNKKIAKVVKTKVKAGKAVVTIKGKKKGKTVLKLNIGGKTAKTTIKVK